MTDHDCPILDRVALFALQAVCTVIAWIVGGTIGGLVGAGIVWAICRAF